MNVVPRKTPRKALLPTAAKHAPEKQSYKFDHVLGQQSTQSDLCSAVDVPDKVASCVAGYAHETQAILCIKSRFCNMFAMQESVPLLRVWANGLWEDSHYPWPTCDGTGPGLYSSALDMQRPDCDWEVLCCRLLHHVRQSQKVGHQVTTECCTLLSSRGFLWQRGPPTGAVKSRYPY